MVSSSASPIPIRKRYFFDKFGITERLLERCLGEALSAGGDYADLYFESVTAISLGVDEQIVKSASQGTSAGCGIRVISGERTGYAYTDNLNPDRLLHAAKTAALIASGPAKQPVQGFTEAAAADLYPVPLGGFDLDLAARLELILRADRAARAYDARITQVRANYSEEVRRIMVAGSDGSFASDTQPLARLGVFVIAKDTDGTDNHQRFGGRGRPRGSGAICGEQRSGAPGAGGGARRNPAARRGSGAGGRNGSGAGARLARNSTARGGGPRPGGGLQSQGNLGVHGPDRPAGGKPAGHGGGQRHHGRPARIAERGRRGLAHARNRADRKRRAERLFDRQAFGAADGRGEYGIGPARKLPLIPMPRMTNTYMLAGQDEPEDIIRSVKRGLYAPNFGGGSVDITSGKFVFSASEAYLIEDGKITAPVRDATLIGNGPEALKHVSMVGHDLKLDEGIGTCGKDGQSVPVGVGIPTIKLDRMTVGGTGR